MLLAHLQLFHSLCVGYPVRLCAWEFPLRLCVCVCAHRTPSARQCQWSLLTWGSGRKIGGNSPWLTSPVPSKLLVSFSFVNAPFPIFRMAGLKPLTPVTPFPLPVIYFPPLFVNIDRKMQPYSPINAFHFSSLIFTSQFCARFHFPPFFCAAFASVIFTSTCCKSSCELEIQKSFHCILIYTDTHSNAHRRLGL